MKQKIGAINSSWRTKNIIFGKSHAALPQLIPNHRISKLSQPTITARQFYEDLVEALDKADQRNNLRLAVLANDFARVKELLENGVTAFFESKDDVAAGTKFTDDRAILNILHFFKIIWITPLINRQDVKKIDADKFAEILLRQDRPQCILAIQKLQTYTIDDAEPNIIDSVRMAEIWMNEYSYSPDVDRCSACKNYFKWRRKIGLRSHLCR